MKYSNVQTGIKTVTKRKKKKKGTEMSGVKVGGRLRQLESDLVGRVGNRKLSSKDNTLL